MHGIERYPYFACDGGPHLVLPRALATLWAGLPVDSDAFDPSTDYGRACAMAADVGLLEVGQGHALVLGDSPPLTSWAPLSTGAGLDLFVLQEWHTRDLDSMLDDARAAMDGGSTEAAFEWSVPDGGVALLFAGDTIAESVYGVHDLPLLAGKYGVATVDLDVEAGTVRVCRLSRV